MNRIHYNMGKWLFRIWVVSGIANLIVSHIVLYAFGGRHEILEIGQYIRVFLWGPIPWIMQFFGVL